MNPLPAISPDPQERDAELQAARFAADKERKNVTQTDLTFGEAPGHLHKIQRSRAIPADNYGVPYGPDREIYNP